jgi:hypothetical protein
MRRLDNFLVKSTTNKRTQVIWFFLLVFIFLTGHQRVSAQITEVKINVEKEGDVISKYIYGQVITNLYNGESGIGVFEQAFKLSGIAGGTCLSQFNISGQHYTKILTHLSSENYCYEFTQTDF